MPRSSVDLRPSRLDIDAFEKNDHLELIPKTAGSPWAVSYSSAKSSSLKEANMWRKARIIGIGTALLVGVLGVTAAVSEDAAPARLRGTLDQVSGNTLTIKARNGTPTTVQLKDGAPVIATVKGSMSDIQDNSFVGITALPQPDGTIKAVEVHVFAEPLRGIGEGHYPWDLMPNSSMTNAAVTQQVKKADGNTLMLKYKDGEKTIVVPSDATVVNLIPGDREDLKPGAKIFIPRWEKRADGTWEATVALVGRDGITPPM
jgi:hypothetical protein